MAHARLYALCSLFCGIQIIWSLQTANASALLLELGLSKKMLPVVWLAGPLAGIIAQPLVGAASDRRGSRRPYILLGAFICTASCLTFSSSPEIGAFLMGDARVFALVAFWCLDVSLNIMMAPLRAALVDEASLRQQGVGNSLFAFFISLGNILGYTLGFFVPKVSVFRSKYQAEFVGGVTILLFTMLISVSVMTTEDDDDDDDDEESQQQAEHDETEEHDKLLPDSGGKGKASYSSAASRKSTGIAGLFTRISRAASEFPKSLYRVVIAMTMSWYAWQTVFMFLAVFVAVEVKGGHADLDGVPDQAYDDGLTLAKLAFMIQAAVGMICSYAMPFLTYHLGATTVWGTGQLFLGVSLVLLPFFGKSAELPLLIMFAGMGLSWAALLTIPWTLASHAVYGSKHAASLLALVNLSACIPEVLASLLSLTLFHASDSATYATALAVGGAVSITSSIFVFFGLNDATEYARRYEIDDSHDA